jgi:sugar phosphate isomerase/epimerase
MALAGLAVPYVFDRRLLADTRFGGVLIGAQTYSFRSMQDPNAIVAAIKSMGISAVELMSNHAEALAGAPSGRARGAGSGANRGGGAAAAPVAGAAPVRPTRRGADGRRARSEDRCGGPQTPEQAAANEAAQAELRAWRAGATDSTWKAVRQKFADAGSEVRFLTYNLNVRTTTDEELDYAFRMAKGLGVKVITSSTQISMAKRLLPFLEKHQITVAFHGHASVNNPDETSTEATFEQAMSESKWIAANLDIGHYVVAGGDPVAFLNKHHARVTNLHLKDRTKAGGNVAFGQGDTPIKDVLLLLKKTKWDIPANIEFEYQGDPLVEVPKCIQYCKDALV